MFLIQRPVRYWDKSKFAEFFAGLKETRTARVNSLLFLAMRTLIPILLISLSFLDVQVKVCIFSFLQLCCTIYHLWVRPYDEMKDNICEGVNQVSLLACCAVLFYFNTESSWSSWSQSMYSTVLVSTPGIG